MLADRRAFRWMRERLLEDRPDVVHTHMGKAGALGRLAAHAAGVPVVVHTFHGHHLTASIAKRVAARLAERSLARRTTVGICLSESQRHDLVERFRVLPPEKAVVIGPGIDVAAFRASVDPARVAEIRARHADRAGALLVWLGRFVRVKDPLRAATAACAAATLAKGRPPPFHLAMLGEGPLRARVARGAADPASRGSVSAPGAVADPQNWIAAADAVVISSRSEGTPIAAVEAACLGVPVVATAVGGLADVVAHDETGLLVPADDHATFVAAMTWIATDAPLRARLGSRARREADVRFGAERLVRETAALYERCLRE
jgi:glycosyltransferase involved in cell wall biosynthesis